MWAAFRVGRRAQVSGRLLGGASAEGSHDGYWPALHRRRFHLEPHRLRIEDQVTGAGGAAEIFLHFHPAVRIDAGTLVARHKAGPAARVVPPADWSWRIEETAWRPEFGLQIPNQTLILRGMAPLAVETEIRFL
jgi:hypothetical protein